MYKTFLCAIISFLFISCNAQQEHYEQYVELDKNAPIYQSPEETGVKLNTDVEAFFEGYTLKGQALFPFTQQVVSAKGDWIQLPYGWVQKKYTKPVSNTPIPEDVYNKHFSGSLMDPNLKNGNRGLAIDFNLNCVKVDENNRDVLVFLARVWESGIFYTAKLSDNMIKCEKFIHVKQAELDENVEGLDFEVYREHNGMKSYTLTYGSRLNKQVEEFIVDTYMSVDVLDFDKFTSEDYRHIYEKVQELGSSTQLCISANTFENLEELTEEQ